VTVSYSREYHPYINPPAVLSYEIRSNGFLKECLKYAAEDAAVITSIEENKMKKKKGKGTGKKC
jgi:hypothetical protein